MTRRLTFVASLTAATLVLAAAVPAMAFRQPDPGQLDAKAHRHPDLYIGNLYKHPGDLPAAAAGSVARDLQSLGVDADLARVDRRSGRFGTLILQQPLLPGAGNDLAWGDLGAAAPASDAELARTAWDAFYAWVSANRDALRIDPAELRQPGNVTVHRGGAYIQIHVPRQIAGIPVRDSHLTAVVNAGNLILFGAHNWADVAVPPVAELSFDEARDLVLAYVSPAAPNGFRRGINLEYVPLSRGGVDPAAVSVGQGLAYRLAWVVRPRFDGIVADWEALVDARTGELVAFEDKANYGVSTRTIIGGVYPVSNDGTPPDGVEQVYPLPFADLTAGGTTFITDAGGNLPSCVDGTVSSVLSGPFVSMTDICGVINESTAGNVLDLGTSGGTDCIVPAGHSAGDTHATRSGFYELNKIQEMGRGHTPNLGAVNSSLPATMNINNVCNASGGAGGVNFFRSGSGCANTGEIAGVFDHEWGHYMDALDAAPGISSPGEGIADIYASLRLNTSCIGRNFRPGVPCPGYGDPCTPASGCTGVRDIDWANRTSGLPHDIVFIDAACGGGTAPCGGSVHCEGAVYAESVWDIWNRDLQSVYGLSTDEAREVASRLTFLGGQLVTVWYNCVNGTGTGDGCNANGGYLNFLAADDDDGNLANGTPHMEAIFDAFDRHDIACPTPTVQTSGCAGGPTTAPTVTATALDRGVHLSWTAVAGATTYRVYRTEGEFGCDFGKTLIGEVSGLTFTDKSGLANGREYYYQVFAVGNGDTCFGPPSSCTTAIPVAGPNLSVEASAFYDVLTGDSDPFVDNCENVRVYFPITNIGTGTQNDVRALSIDSPSHPAIDATITFPAEYANTLVACGSVFGWFDFRASGLVFNDVIEFDVAVTSDELEAQLPGQSKAQSYSIGFTESDLQSQASKLFTFEAGTESWTVESGTFNRTGGGGGSGTTFKFESSAFVPNQCDKIRSPLMALASTSTLSLQNNYEIEPFSGTWYDRANVALESTSGTRTVVNPNGGRLYNASNGGPGTYSGCNDGEMGWAAANTTWGASTWSAANFGALAPSGLLQIEVTYSTDPGDHRRGFWFDEVNVTDLSLQVVDTQSNSCPVDDLIFADGFESGDAAVWTNSVGGP